MKCKKLLCLVLGLLMLGTSGAMAKYVGGSVAPLGTQEPGGYLPDIGDVYIDDSGVIVSSFKWINPQFDDYPIFGTYYEHEFRIENDPNKDKISYRGQYITNLPDGYVDPDDLGVGGNAEEIVDGKQYYSYVWISGASGVRHTNCYLEGEEGIYLSWAPSSGYPKKYYPLVENVEFYMGADSQTYTWNKNFGENFVSSNVEHSRNAGSSGNVNPSPKKYAILLKEKATLPDLERLLGNTSLLTSLESKFMEDGHLDGNEKNHLEFLRTTKEKLLEKLRNPKGAHIKFKVIVENVECAEIEKFQNRTEIVENITRVRK